MPSDIKSPPVGFALNILPWVMAGVFLTVYGVTLNPWVSPESLGTVASLTGMIWGPEHLEPVTYLITLPLRALPATQIPLALNLISAVCAALVLALLARSASLLRHKKYRHKLEPFRDAPTVLQSRLAWLPPLLAVTVCGLQFSFWYHAINATSEMINLLLFAYVVRCFPEYQSRRENGWLLRGAFVYGLALANDWLYVAFLPAIIIALCRVKDLNFFNVPFASRLLRNPGSFNLRLLVLFPAVWLAGLAVFLVKPMLELMARPASESFWTVWRVSVKNHLAAFPLSTANLVITALVTLIPAVYILFCYHQNFKELKRLNHFIPRICFHVMFIFWGLLCLWIMFDSPLSPRWMDLGPVGLPLYFLAALGVGFFTGHFVRIAESTRKTGHKARPRPKRFRPGRRPTMDVALYFKRGLMTLTGGVAVVATAWLISKNLPQILRLRNGPLSQYFAQLSQQLPARGAVVICNDSLLQDFAEAAVLRAGHPAGCLFLNADALIKNPEYIGFLRRKYPELESLLPVADFAIPTNRETAVVNFLKSLAQTRELYCLQPAQVFEDFAGQLFYPQPAGLVYQMKPYGSGTQSANPVETEPVPTADYFWASVDQQDFGQFLKVDSAVQSKSSAGVWKKMLTFHPELDQQTLLAKNFLAAAWNNWGVEQQKRGHFTAAGTSFKTALELNPDNSAAQINWKFNQDYLAKKSIAIRSAREEDANLAGFGDWKNVARDGLVDEPNYCNLIGQILANAHLYRPAIEQFTRVKKLAPGELAPQANLAMVYFDIDAFALANAEASQVIASEPTNQTALFIKGISSAQLGAYEPAIVALTDLLAGQPKDSLARLNRAVCYVKTGRVEAARKDYELVTQTYPDAYSAYYSLAEIAYHTHDQADSIKNYELFLKYAPLHHPQIELAESRLKVLKTMMQ